MVPGGMGSIKSRICLFCKLGRGHNENAPSSGNCATISPIYLWLKSRAQGGSPKAGKPPKIKSVLVVSMSCKWDVRGVESRSKRCSFNKLARTLSRSFDGGKMRSIAPTSCQAFKIKEYISFLVLSTTRTLAFKNSWKEDSKLLSTFWAIDAKWASSEATIKVLTLTQVRMSAKIMVAATAQVIESDNLS